MVILIDTREQCPLKFSHKWVESTEKTTLDTGDYSCRFKDGHIPSVFFERKTLSDLFGTLGKGYPRFKREIIRATEKNAILILIIEATLTQIKEGYNRSQRDGQSVVDQMFTLMVKHRVPFVCCKDRKEMAAYIADFYTAIGKLRLDQKDAENQPKG